MSDRITKEVRSQNMSKIRSKNTKPEIKIRSLLHRNGFRFRLYNKDLPGKPDIVLKKWNTIILVNGCFWHQHMCKKTYIPMSNTGYWIPKLENNKKRLKKNNANLKKIGWNVIIIWECQINSWSDDKIIQFLEKKIYRK